MPEETLPDSDPEVPGLAASVVHSGPSHSHLRVQGGQTPLYQLQLRLFQLTETKRTQNEDFDNSSGRSGMET